MEILNDQIDHKFFPADQRAHGAANIVKGLLLDNLNRAIPSHAPANRGIELINERVIPHLETVLGVPLYRKHVSFSFQKPEKQVANKAMLI